MKEEIQRIVSAHQTMVDAIHQSDAIQEAVAQCVETIVSAYKNGKKVFFCGNGGSAADAQHLAAELSGRFYLNRPPLFAEALHVNSSYITAVANDFSYDLIYARILEAKGNEGDVLIALSTSGQSKNILEALQVARDQKLHTIGMTGNKENPMQSLCDTYIQIPSADTPRIQEAQMLLGHIICQYVESKIFA